MPASLIEPKKPFQTWTSTQADKSHQPIRQCGLLWCQPIMPRGQVCTFKYSCCLCYLIKKTKQESSSSVLHTSAVIKYPSNMPHYFNFYKQHCQNGIWWFLSKLCSWEMFISYKTIGHQLITKFLTFYTVTFMRDKYYSLQLVISIYLSTLTTANNTY